MRQRPKPSKLKAKLPVAPKPLRAEDATVRDLEKRLAEALKRESAAQGQLQIRDRELAETHEQQTATAEILDAISRSPTDLQPILEAVAQNASRLCGAANVSLYRVEGDQMRKVAEQGRPLTALRVWRDPTNHPHDCERPGDRGPDDHSPSRPPVRGGGSGVPRRAA